MQDILSYAKSLGFNTEMHQNCSMEQLQGFVDKGN